MKVLSQFCLNSFFSDLEMDRRQKLELFRGTSFLSIEFSCSFNPIPVLLSFLIFLPSVFVHW